MKRAALITGSGRGIGKAIACRLAETMPVIINYRSDAAAAAQVRAEIEREGGLAIVCQADVSDCDEVRRLFADIGDAGYWVHTLINNAGVAKDGIAAMMALDDWHRVIACNLNGAFYCAKEAIGAMITRRSGVVVNVSSTSGVHGQAGQSNYSAAKAGVIGLTKSLAKELARFGIRVNCVAPGFIETDMIAEFRKMEKANAMIEFAKKELIPLRRLGSPAEVAEVVAFLASSKAAYMTGQVLEVDGGLAI